MWTRYRLQQGRGAGRWRISAAALVGAAALSVGVAASAPVEGPPALPGDGAGVILITLTPPPAPAGQAWPISLGCLAFLLFTRAKPRRSGGNPA